MGTMLMKLLIEDKDNHVTITSRSSRSSEFENISYIKGDAKELSFLNEIVAENWDVIVDFMFYRTEEFKQRYMLFLEHANQYVFLSSARVYAFSEVPITENSPRLLDVSEDKEFLATDDYALAKARCEDMLNSSGKNNYTIIRPSITYGDAQLRLGYYEKEQWLYRILKGRSLVFSEDIANQYTTMTKGSDVAEGIYSIIGKAEALGESFHITCEKAYTWNEILECYLNVLEKKLGKRPKVIMTKKSTCLNIDKWHVMYCLSYSRRFDNTKIKQFTDVDNFIDPLDGLSQCLEVFLENPRFKGCNWKLEALNDKVAGEHARLNEIPGKAWKLYYLVYRYGTVSAGDFCRRICNAVTRRIHNIC